MKIGAVDTEIALLIVKKEKINASKIYSPVGNLAEQAKIALLQICLDPVLCGSRCRYYIRA